MAPQTSRGLVEFVAFDCKIRGVAPPYGRAVRKSNLSRLHASVLIAAADNSTAAGSTSMHDREGTRQSIGIFLYLPVECLPDDARLTEDLDLDSFERLNLHMALEEETGFEFDLDAAIGTVGDLIEAVEIQMWRLAREGLPFGPQMSTRPLNLSV
jgi:acyl carrier protein